GWAGDWIGTMLFDRIIESRKHPFSWALFTEGPLASTFVHALIIGGALFATRHETGLERLAESFTAPQFLFPKDKIPGARTLRERIDYLKPIDAKMGMGFVNEGEPNDAELKLKKKRGEEAELDVGEPVVAPQRPSLISIDSVYTELQVDTAAARYDGSAAPPYPPTMLEQRKEGQVVVQYVIDSTGRADLASVTIMQSSHPDFATSVTVTLPHMRFRPAKIGPRRVNQLVQQLFSFKIQDTTQVAKTVSQPRKPS
ncbi:MAG: energy transducer TonB, partial [Gemmatimonadaceae bacterium]